MKYGASKCAVCRKGRHNRMSCPLNTSVITWRPGKKKRRTKCRTKAARIRTMRKIRKHPIFTQSKKGKKFLNSERELKRAKKKILKEIDRLEKQVKAKKMSNFELAWFEATGEIGLE